MSPLVFIACIIKYINTIFKAEKIKAYLVHKGVYLLYSQHSPLINTWKTMMSSKAIHAAGNPIFDAAFQGQLATVQSIVKYDKLQITSDNPDGSMVKATDEDQRTPLHWACSGSQLAVAEWLLQNGADVNALDDDSWSPLCIAASVGNSDLVLFLLENKADPNIQTSSGQTALHYAASKNKYEIAEVLLRNGAKPNLANRVGQLPVHRAASLGHFRLLKLLHQFKSPLDIADGEGNTPLHVACEGCHMPIVEYLLEQGVNPLKKNREEKVPFELSDTSFQKALKNHPEWADVIIPKAS